MPEASRTGTVVAFDFGLKRIGVAVGSFETRTAHPLRVIAAESDPHRFDAISEIIREWKPEALIVGVPSHDDGLPHEFAPRCHRFARQLAGRFGLPVTEVDERYSSVVASQTLAGAGVRGRRQKPHIDAVAAATFLQDWLDAAS